MMMMLAGEKGGWRLWERSADGDCERTQDIRIHLNMAHGVSFLYRSFRCYTTQSGKYRYT